MIKIRIAYILEITNSELNTNPSKSDTSVQDKPKFLYRYDMSIDRNTCLNFDIDPLKVITVVSYDIDPDT